MQLIQSPSSLPETATPCTPVYSIHLSISHNDEEPTSRINGRDTELLQEQRRNEYNKQTVTLTCDTHLMKERKTCCPKQESNLRLLVVQLLSCLANIRGYAGSIPAWDDMFSFLS